MRKLLESSTSPQARLNAALAAPGLNAVQARRLADSDGTHPAAPAHGIKLAEQKLDTGIPKLLDAVLCRADDIDITVRFPGGVFRWAESQDAKAAAKLAELVRRNPATDGCGRPS
ncbi:MAG: hypothetical protein U0992_17155 [Planctomycetaceae bacterium]